MERLLDIDNLDEDAPFFGIACFNLQKRRPEVLVLNMLDPEAPQRSFPFEIFGTARFPEWSNGWSGIRPLTAAGRKWWRVSKAREKRRRK